MTNYQPNNYQRGNYRGRSYGQRPQAPAPVPKKPKPLTDYSPMVAATRIKFYVDVLLAHLDAAGYAPEEAAPEGEDAAR